MNKKETAKILKRLERIETAIVEIRGVLNPQASDGDMNAEMPQPRHMGKTEHESEWTSLRKRILSERDPTPILRDFITRNTKEHIKHLIQTNNLPVDPKASKAEQLRQFLKLVAVTRAITGYSVE